MTQEELGKRVGVVKQTISTWEKETSSPGFDKLVQLADIFSVSTDYILGVPSFRNKKREMEEVISQLDAISNAVAELKLWVQKSVE